MEKKMKNSILSLALALTFLTSAASADQGIYPKAVTSVPTSPFVTCTFDNLRADYSELYVTDAPLMIGGVDIFLKLNPAYAEDGVAPYIMFHGVKATINPHQIAITTTLMTVAGPVLVDQKFGRQIPMTKRNILGFDLTCKTR
jgi:hypothetical protein